ncbi:MAG: hypothetical protein KF861_00435 [Planctomycetaceae bacterium]|nr:hypothetical protein [Planctomycetaceae bacterium]
MGRESLNYRRGRSGRPYRRTKAEVFANETHCRRCGNPVDKSLPYKDPTTGKVNAWSKSYGHKVELDRNGNPYVGGLEHLHCNVAAGARYVNAKRSRKRLSAPGGTDSSHDWS